MVSTRAAARYAKAMLEVSGQKGNAEAINSDMILISESVSQSEDLKVFLTNPIVSGEIKLNALLEVFANVDQSTKELFKVLKANNRFEILGVIALQFQEQYEALKGIERVVVTTAVPMDAALESKVLSKVQSLAPGKQIVISNIVDASILGGFILKMGDKQYNASIANQLQVLKRELTN
ncbi:ATP synthase F1 subunit delta [Myroides odoratimimus]|uniref:ATP synthase subunit delta n=1 Tax=Myroides profundi TaxID=480520 RepID=A0AAJ5BCN3_MYRPR|nr:MULTISPECIES: ATP synthase F1 subunit delta [Myroides]AJH13312.1 F-type H+-transporting ATPase subunit delta [Myroides profundi]EPH11137.1 ATP synthase F1, delta subunit [Myroides odoratimimus CCUG 12700]MDM1092295.1 ATP synthase F1 subunit delta [Myroides odoratimimus]MDM1325687.1 ATP synthase F1 subunit delta [Myroides odoratimimus]MDM1400305.1 ATP synthase F1 subunit delta [Myroides odoratimimus]